MRADNSIHLVTAAQQRHELTRAKAIAAMHELDRTGAVITFESVARHAGVSRSWIYTQPDIKDEIHRLRAQHRGPTAPIPSHQRASDESLRRRLRNLEPPQPRTRRRQPAATPPTRQRARSTPRQRTNPTRRRPVADRNSVTISPRRPTKQPVTPPRRGHPPRSKPPRSRRFSANELKITIESLNARYRRAIKTGGTSPPSRPR
jgi:Family of unknown function (DUF6262)